MSITTRLLMAACATLLVGATSLPADAAQTNLLGLGVNTGNTANGGTSITVGNSVAATLGGGSNIASLTTNATGNGTTVGIGNTNGPLIASTSDDNGTSTNVNLGGVGAGGLGLGGLGLGDLGLGDLGLGDLGDLGGLLPGDGNAGGGGDNGAAARIDVAFASLGGGQQQQLRLRCQSILSSPGAFDGNLVALCRMIARINATQ